MVDSARIGLWSRTCGPRWAFRHPGHPSKRHLRASRPIPAPRPGEIYQELFGGPSDLPWALEVDPSRRPDAYALSATFHPTFLYEMLWNFAGRGADHLGRTALSHPPARRLLPLRGRLLAGADLLGAAARSTRRTSSSGSASTSTWRSRCSSVRSATSSGTAGGAGRKPMTTRPRPPRRHVDPIPSGPRPSPPPSRPGTPGPAVTPRQEETPPLIPRRASARRPRPGTRGGSRAAPAGSSSAGRRRTRGCRRS